MSKKLKGRANPLAELHFIADVPLEQAVRLIGNMADDKHAVTLTEVDTNNFKFEISSNSKINGTLQRWQGTETRVSCDGKVANKEDYKSKIIFVLLIVAFLSVLVAIDAGVIAIWIAILIAVSNGRADRNSLETNNDLLFRERDRLLQLVIDTFKAAGKIEPYDIEKRQKRLHGNILSETYRGDTTDDSDRQTAKHKHNRL